MSDDAAATAKKRRRESDAIEQSRKKRAKRQKTRSTIQEEAASLVKSADTQYASLLTSNPGAVDPLKIASANVILAAVCLEGVDHLGKPHDTFSYRGTQKGTPPWPTSTWFDHASVLLQAGSLHSCQALQSGESSDAVTKAISEAPAGKKMLADIRTVTQITEQPALKVLEYTGPWHASLRDHAVNSLDRKRGRIISKAVGIDSDVTLPEDLVKVEDYLINTVAVLEAATAVVAEAKRNMPSATLFPEVLAAATDLVTPAALAAMTYCIAAGHRTSRTEVGPELRAWGGRDASRKEPSGHWMGSAWADFNRLVPGDHSYTNVKVKNGAPRIVLEHWATKSSCFGSALELCVNSDKFALITGDPDDLRKAASEAFSSGASVHVDDAGGAFVQPIEPSQFLALMTQAAARRSSHQFTAAAPGPDSAGSAAA